MTVYLRELPAPSGGSSVTVCSPVSATIPWQEGREEDFSELREGLRRLREGEELEAESDGESEEEEDRQVDEFAQFHDTEEEDEDEEDEDPGEEKPGEVDEGRLIVNLSNFKNSLVSVKNREIR